jgi:DNA-binding NarL/FixJ family response regulator
MGFKDKFNRSNPRFLEILLKKHPSLTQREILLCMYLKLNYSSNDISDELDIAIASVDTYWSSEKVFLNSTFKHPTIGC